MRSLFGHDSVDSRSCALGVSVQAGSKGSTYTVYATDGTARAELAECWSQKGAARALRRLEACFAIDRSDPRRGAVQTRVDAERQRTEATYAAARAQVDAYYQSGASRRVWYWMLGGLLIYLVVIWLYTWLTGSRL